MTDYGDWYVMSENITYQMHKNGKSRKDIAEDLGISYTTVTEWLTGQQYPTGSQIAALAKYFGIRPDDLYDKRVELKGGFDVSRELAKKRIEAGLTQDSLAKLVGYKTAKTIYNIENGISEIPPSKLAKFAEVLNTPISDLLKWEKIKKSSDITSTVNYKIKNNETFHSIIEMLVDLDENKLETVKKLISAFFE